MKINTDHIGTVLSCTCLLHCIALPFILVWMGIYNDTEWLHSVFFVGAILITGHAMWHSYKKHCKHIVIFFGCMGILLLGLDIFLPHTHTVAHGDHSHEVNADSEILTIIGSVFLVSTHLLNLYYNRRLHTCENCKK